MTAEQRAWLVAMPLSPEHPNRIRVAALLQRRSLAELAEICGLSRWRMERMANGEVVRIVPESALALSNALDLSLEELFANRPDSDEQLPRLSPEPIPGLPRRGGGRA